MSYTKSSSLNIDERALLGEFNQRVEEGVVIYDSDHRVIRQVYQGFPFEFRIFAGHASKPEVSSSGDTSLASSAETPEYLPGSDISLTGFEIRNSSSDVGPAHYMIFNKFCAARPHYLLLTQDGHRRQHESLNMDDFHTLWGALAELNKNWEAKKPGARRYLGMFNCGIDSGCSRLHKHMQVLAVPEESEFRLWPDSGSNDGGQEHIPFKYYKHNIDEQLDESSRERAAWTKYLAFTSAAHQALADIGHVPHAPDGVDLATIVPHNVILTREWLLVIPRTKAGMNGADANAAGYLGMVWVSDEERVKRWTDQGPTKLLTSLGLPNNN
ncbi:putative 5',5'''-P-1,P-4-tetraphosphate phosphorylase [Triangularia verruculosa]|uniref:5',5'''-P-1,P-4-tetraphosphate phosphorylase n=1 Tax=Triangularia verruculosa TaxID=2587418 RepID=A0AAN7ARP3_9PEZI|nr:putative 5',5'''-P-1,P-4-tetraphosphate phosphorylase [Triangularia verruculosa]